MSSLSGYAGSEPSNVMMVPKARSSSSVSCSSRVSSPLENADCNSFSRPPP
ncbi:hypothetical protein [Brachybacterium sacelli]|uniref:hypothetical protein n=1 Tax=Brachybacterium sacelli TaxID=173364 RepID=UPI003610FA53